MSGNFRCLIQQFLSLLQGMEANVNLLLAASRRKTSSYPTYEEWKPIRGCHYPLPKACSYPTCRQGMKQVLLKLFRIHFQDVLILPIWEMETFVPRSRIHQFFRFLSICGNGNLVLFLFPSLPTPCSYPTYWGILETHFFFSNSFIKKIFLLVLILPMRRWKPKYIFILPFPLNDTLILPIKNGNSLKKLFLSDSQSIFVSLSYLWGNGSTFFVPKIKFFSPHGLLSYERNGNEQNQKLLKSNKELGSLS